MTYSAFTAVDLSQLPPPSVVESLSFEAILGAMLSDLQLRDPAFTALVESDPAFKILEVCAYREVILRERVNDAARSVMLAYAAGADLDQIGANYGLSRLLIVPADPDASPPISAVYESDTAFRRRLQLSFEAYSTAGSAGSYVFRALSADPDVLDVAVSSPAPGVVDVVVMAASGAGTPSAGLLATVEAALSADEVRPLTDYVEVRAVSLVAMTVEAVLHVASGPDPVLVVAAAEAALAALIASSRRVGAPIARSAIYAALHQPGVMKVDLVSPVAEPVVDADEAINVTSTTISYVLA